jgi:hypothetical protein
VSCSVFSPLYRVPFDYARVPSCEGTGPYRGLFYRSRTFSLVAAVGARITIWVFVLPHLTSIADKDEEEQLKREERAANERKVIAAGEAMRASAFKRRSAKYLREFITDGDGDPSRSSGDASSRDGSATAPANKKRQSSSGSAASFSYDEDKQGVWRSPL